MSCSKSHLYFPLKPKIKKEFKASTKFAFRSFPGLPDKETLNKPSISERLFLIHRMILTDRNDEAIRACSELQTLALQGLKYLQRCEILCRDPRQHM
ncbi:uncharacterized protein VP01_433g1 [Puccinia sorghi]|uniref:Uncharacterized protein n=1 Tax=Puccinia sorghi TaxID=27349 RepID=A0A0L6UQQ1_9BASI|nr:uncharacterized protein VP01_433g1 [Puccinia sorghi]